MIFRLDPKKFSDYTPEPILDGSEIVPLVKAGQNSAATVETIRGPGGGGAVDSVNGQTGVVALDTSDVPDTLDKRYVTDAEKTKLGNTSGTNSGDQDLSSLQPKDSDLTTIAAIDSSLTGVLASDGSGWLRKTYTALKTAIGLTKSDVGLSNVDNTSDTAKPISTATQTALNAKQNSLGFTPENSANKGSANGYADLDSNGLIPSSQLPSYVDDVIEVANFAALPGTGETGKIYVTKDDNKTYRWSGTAYVEISASLALGETTSTAYRGDRGKIAYDHSQLTTGNPHNVTKSEIGLGSADNTSDASKPVSTAQAAAIAIVQADIDGHEADTSNPHAVTKTQIGLSNVDNTSNATERAATATLTNKRITPRITTITSSATPTINTDNCDTVTITALAADITSMTTNLSGTPNHFDKLIVRFKDDGTARAITWGTSFEACGVVLPTTTVVSKRLTVGFLYSTTTSKWGCVASVQET